MLHQKVGSIVLSLFTTAAVSAFAQTGPATTQIGCGSGGAPLIVHHAGSLTREFQAAEKAFAAQAGACVTDVANGSVDDARQVTSGGQPADVFAAADYFNIEQFLRPVGYADYNIAFATTDMVLAYATTSKHAGTIAAAGQAFNPPASIPQAAPDWYKQVTGPGVLIADTNAFLDPTGYRTDLIFQLTASLYRDPFLYNTLLEHYVTARSNDVIGRTFDYQILYESSALANYEANPSTYRFVRLPAAVNLSDLTQELTYQQASTVIPGTLLPGSAPKITVPGTRVVFGVTILKNAPHPALAVRFLEYLFSSEGMALQTADGPTPLNRPLVTPPDYPRLPEALKPLVAVY